MRILNSPFKEDILKIAQSSTSSSGSFLLEITLQTKAGLPIPIERVHQKLLERDYLRGLGDKITMVIESSRATYEHLVHPNRRDLRCSITMTPCDKNGNHPGDPFTVDYRAKLTNPKDLTVILASLGGDRLSDKQADSYPFAVQLVETALDDFKGMTMSGILHDCTVLETIEGICSNLGTFPISVHPPDNEETYPIITMEQSHPVLEHANWMQSEGRGVYNHGCGTYFMHGWVFVYPLTLTEKHPDRKRHVVYRCAPDEMIGVENTYRVEGEVAYILVTGEVEYLDDTERRERTSGNAIVFDSNPDYYNDRVSHEDGVSTFENDTWTTIANDERLVNVSKTYCRQTTNIYRERSRLTESQGKIIELTWTNANAKFFPPNTELEIHYLNAGEMYTLSGIVVGYFQEANAVPIKGNRSVFHPVGRLRVRLK